MDVDVRRVRPAVKLIFVMMIVSLVWGLIVWLVSVAILSHEPQEVRIRVRAAQQLVTLAIAIGRLVGWGWVATAGGPRVRAPALWIVVLSVVGYFWWFLPGVAITMTVALALDLSGTALYVASAILSWIVLSRTVALAGGKLPAAPAVVLLTIFALDTCLDVIGAAVQRLAFGYWSDYEALLDQLAMPSAVVGRALQVTWLVVVWLVLRELARAPDQRVKEAFT